MAKQYRKKPIEVEAFRWLIDETPEWWTKISGKFMMDMSTQQLYIPTNEGTMIANKGDYIIKEPFDSERQVYPCKPDIFDKTYEPVKEQQ